MIKFVATPADNQEIYYIEQHLHADGRTLGKSGDQSGNNWGTEDSLTLFRAVSGNGDFGADANDEAKVIGSDDTPVISGMAKSDMHRILVVATSSQTTYVVRVVYGTGTMAAAISANQYSTFPYIKESASGRGAPANIQIGRKDAGTKIWIQVKNATNNATLDFLVQSHEYAY